MTKLSRRILIVTSAFPPAMLADMHRARSLAQHLPESGWNVEVLVPGLGFQRSIWVESDAEKYRATKAGVHEVKPICDWAFKSIGVRSVGWRSFWPLYRHGVQLLRDRQFDLVYISTTQFILFCLGPLWRRKFSIPYVLDFHDPWYRDLQKHITTEHRTKLLVSNWVSKWLERLAVTRAAGITAVSASYLDVLEKRHAKITATTQRRAVFPFPANESDLRHAAGSSPASGERTNDRPTEIVYVGAGGQIMMKSFLRIVDVLLDIEKHEPALLLNIKIRLFGTYAYWKEGDSKPLQEAAVSRGVGFVEEHPARITYSSAMKLISRADGLLILGVDDPGYVPSKFFTYSLTGKPLLVCLHADSQANRYFERVPGLGHLIHFGQTNSQIVDQRQTVRSWLKEAINGQCFDRRQILASYLSEFAARQQSEFFESVLSS